MRVVEYNDSMMSIWDDFVFKSKNGTLLHTQKFLSYHAKGKWTDKSIMIYDKSELKAVFPACEIDDKIISHQGSSSGGFVVSTKNKLIDAIAFFKLTEKHFKSYKEIIYKKHETIFDKLPSDEVEFAAIKSGFKPIHFELSTCVNLDSIAISENRSDKVNRASKKIKIKIDDDNYELYHKILTDNLLNKYNVTPTHTLNEMLLLKSLLPNHFILFSAYYEDKLVAGIFAIKLNNKVIHTLYIAQDYTYKHLYSTSLLLFEVINNARNEGFEYVNFGVSTEQNGELVNEGLFNFKESFGGAGVKREVYSKRL